MPTSRDGAGGSEVPASQRRYVILGAPGKLLKAVPVKPHPHHPETVFLDDFRFWLEPEQAGSALIAGQPYAVFALFYVDNFPFNCNLWLEDAGLARQVPIYGNFLVTRYRGGEVALNMSLLEAMVCIATQEEWRVDPMNLPRRRLGEN